MKATCNETHRWESHDLPAVIPDKNSSAFSWFASIKKALPSAGPSLQGLSQLPTWIGWEVGSTSPTLARVAPAEKSEPTGSCEARPTGFFACFLTEEFNLVFCSNFSSLWECSKSILNFSNFFRANSCIDRACHKHKDHEVDNRKVSDTNFSKMHFCWLGNKGK